MKCAAGMWFPDLDAHMTLEYTNGRTQQDTWDEAVKFVDDFSVAVDAGAFIGLFSLWASAEFDQVHAFEPAEDTRLCLRKNIEDNKLQDKITIWPYALGDKEKTAGMAQDERWVANTGGRYLISGDEVKVTTLDKLKLSHLGLFKIDVEGYELFALKGAEQTLRRTKPVIIVEEKSRLASRQGVDVKEIRAYLATLGAKPVKKVRSDVIYRFGKVRT